MIVGYDPHRVADLGRRTRDALSRLSGITSDDPAADGAVAALTRLRTTLESSLLPAVTAIETTDPLMRAARRPSVPSGRFGEWFSAMIALRLRAMTDAELLAELDRLERAAPYDHEFQPDMGDPFWTRFDVVASELSERASIDPDFADRLVEHTRESFLIPMAVRFATFHPRLVGRMLREVTRTPSAMVDLRSMYQARGAEELLSVLTRHPDVALEVLDDTMLAELIRWPIIDAVVVGGFLNAAMEVPFADPTRLDDAYGVLQRFVALANSTHHESGFPPGISPAITRIVVQYVPFFITSLGGYSDVHLKGFDFRDVEMRLGTYPEVLDLFGALMRDRGSLEVLLASIPGLAIIGAGDDGPLAIGPNDVADYVDTVDKAAENEQLEQRLQAEQKRNNALVATDIAFGALRTASTVLSPVAIGGVAVSLTMLEKGTESLIRWAARETDLGLADVGNAAFLLVVFGLGVGVLHSRSAMPDEDAHDDEAATFELAEDILGQIETRVEAGADIEDLGGLVHDFGRAVRPLDVARVMEIVDDPRVLPPDAVVERNVDHD